MSTEVRMTIEGEGVAPKSVVLADLIALLKDFQAALTATAGGATGIALTKINEGSSELVFDTDTTTYGCANALIVAIANEDASQLPDAARSRVRELWKRASQRKWSLVLDTRNGQSSARAVLTPDRPPFGAPFTRGSTSQLVYVTRVGGEPQPTATVRLPDDERITAQLESKSIAEKLAAHLYQFVEVRGDAKWSTDTWKLKRLLIREVGPYFDSESNPRKALDVLTEQSHGCWDKIDPDEFIREQRADD
jgi:hypothetical protein